MVNNFKNVQRKKLKKWQNFVHMSNLADELEGKEKNYFIKQLINFEKSNK
jgi:hypothetical protein